MDTPSKKQLLQDLTTSGQLHKKNKSPEWERVFEAFTTETKISLSFTCSNCYKTALKWLKAN